VPEHNGYSSLVHLPGHPYGDLLRRCRYKAYRGGRGGAKSWAFAEALVERSTKARLLIVCTREFQTSIEDSVHRLIKNTIYRMGYERLFTIGKTNIRCNITGAEFIFKGLKDADALKSLEGADICWVEEGQSISLDSLEKLDPTIRKDGSEIWFSWNPEKEDTPVDEFFFGKTPPPAEDMVRHHVNYDQNPYFTAALEKSRQLALRKISEAENDKDRKRAQDAYNHVWLGHKKHISDEVIFAGKVVIEAFADDLWKSAPRLLFGADYGFAQDPATLIRSFILDACLYVEYEAYGTGVELHEMGQFYRSVPESENWPIKADNSRPETTSAMKHEGFNSSSADKWKGSVEDGIAHMLGFKKIIVHPRCVHTIHEFENYKYKVDPQTKKVLPIIIDAFNHCIDALRYSLDGYIQRRGILKVWERLGRQQ
jgi:phage terminase large subunit